MTHSGTTPSSPAIDATTGPGKPDERRKNHALRALIDEMLASIRAAAHTDLWTPEERAQYERELGDIMSRVRSEAILLPDRNRKS